MNKAVVFFLHRIHAVSIGNTADNLYNVIGHHMAELGVKGVEPRELIDLIDGYTLGGHGCVDKTLKGKVLLLCHIVSGAQPSVCRLIMDFFIRTCKSNAITLYNERPCLPGFNDH